MVRRIKWMGLLEEDMVPMSPSSVSRTAFFYWSTTEFHGGCWGCFVFHNGSVYPSSSSSHRLTGSNDSYEFYTCNHVSGAARKDERKGATMKDREIQFNNLNLQPNKLSQFLACVSCHWSCEQWEHQSHFLSALSCLRLKLQRYLAHCYPSPNKKSQFYTTPLLTEGMEWILSRWFDIPSQA